MTQGTGLDAFDAAFPGPSLRRRHRRGARRRCSPPASPSAGMRPVVAVYSTFLQRAFDMLVQDIGLQHLPVVFAVDRAGLVGDDGPTHHGVFDLSYLRMIPDFVGHGALQPGASCSTCCTRRSPRDGPAALRYPRGLAAAVRRAQQLEAAARGHGRGAAARARERRAHRHRHRRGHRARRGRAARRSAGVQPTVVDARFVKPLDTRAAGRARGYPRAPRHGRGERAGRRLRQRRARAPGRQRVPVRALRPARRLRRARRPRAPAARRGPHRRGRRRSRPRAPARRSRTSSEPVRERLDTLLVARGLFATRAQAHAAVLAGEVARRTAAARDKPGTPVDSEAASSPSPSGPGTSRAAATSSITPARARASTSTGEEVCDLGSSTGGFVDCLLQRGAAPRGGRRRRLRPARLAPARRTRASRCWSAPTRAQLDGANVSRTRPVVRHRRRVVHLPDGGAGARARILRAPATAGLVLVKPQFEAGREHVGKGGVVRDPAVHREVLDAGRRVAASSTAPPCWASAIPGIRDQRGTWSTSSISATRERAGGGRADRGRRPRARPWRPLMAEPLRRIAVLTHHWPRRTDRDALAQLAATRERLGLRAHGARRRGGQAPAAHRASATASSTTTELRSADLCLVFGGDGTILRALGRLLDSGVPTLGVNFGNVGFLAGLPQRDWWQRAGAHPRRGGYTRHRPAHRRRAGGTATASDGRQRHHPQPRALAARAAASSTSVSGHAGGQHAVRRHDRGLAGRLHRLQPLLRRPPRRVGRRRPRAQLHRPALAGFPARHPAPRPRHHGAQRLARGRSRGRGRRRRRGPPVLRREVDIAAGAARARLMARDEGGRSTRTSRRSSSTARACSLSSCIDDHAR